jgi:hypothetical protein
MSFPSFWNRSTVARCRPSHLAGTCRCLLTCRTELGNHASTRCPQPPYEPGCRSLCQLILLRLDQPTTVVQCIGLDAGNNDHLAAMKM